MAIGLIQILITCIHLHQMSSLWDLAREVWSTSNTTWDLRDYVVYVFSIPDTFILVCHQG